MFGLPHWQLKSTSTEAGVVAPDERLPLGQTMVMGVQHAVAMFGATVLMPMLMGLDPNLAILMSGMGTLLFFFVTGGRVPSYLGSSAAFVGVVIAAIGRHYRLWAGLHPDRSGGDESRHALDRADDAPRRHRGGGDGDRPEPRADCGEERLRFAV